MPATNKLFDIVKEGDRPSAMDHNEITRQLTALSGIGGKVNAIFTGAGTFIRTVKPVYRERIHFELNEALAASRSWDAAPQTAAADILERDPDYGTLTDTGFGITVVNRTDQAFDYGYQGTALWVDGEWLVALGSCP